jgi:hypothetical protein
MNHKDRIRLGMMLTLLKPYRSEVQQMHDLEAVNFPGGQEAVQLEEATEALDEVIKIMERLCQPNS